jgi:hypothetical protein
MCTARFHGCARLTSGALTIEHRCQLVLSSAASGRSEQRVLDTSTECCTSVASSVTSSQPMTRLSRRLCLPPGDRWPSRSGPVLARAARQSQIFENADDRPGSRPAGEPSVTIVLQTTPRSVAGRPEKGFRRCALVTRLLLG